MVKEKRNRKTRVVCHRKERIKHNGQKNEQLTEPKGSFFMEEKEMINWKVRIKNKMFWLTLIPAVLLLLQAVLKVFGIEMDFTGLGNNLLAVVEALFGVLVILGVVTDPTTEGVSDSTLAMTYQIPKTKEGEIE